MLDGEREAAVPADKQRFGPFEFDPVSGELRNLEDDGPGSVQRLPPQPARLLALLVERQGALVSREEIRTEIWPGVAVDFDASLHFCIRQIRSANARTTSSSALVAGGLWWKAPPLLFSIDTTRSASGAAGRGEEFTRPA